MTTRRVKDIDKNIGGKLQTARLLKGLSQEALGKKLGISFQQIQKYEKGTNRISVSRLMDICKILKTNYEYFLVEDKQLEDINFDRDTVTMCTLYSSKIKSKEVKKALLHMAKVLVEEGK